LQEKSLAGFKYFQRRMSAQADNRPEALSPKIYSQGNLPTLTNFYPHRSKHLPPLAPAFRSGYKKSTAKFPAPANLSKYLPAARCSSMTNSATVASSAANQKMPGSNTAIRWALVSLAAAVGTLGLKFAAWRATGSVGLLSDAVESGVNVVAAATALGAVWYAAQPADRDHPYGHEKIEFFSSGVEGALIVVAALSIAFTSVQGLRAGGSTPGNLEIGAVLSLLATLVNFVVARGLLHSARRLRSIALEADGHHLMSDVWTSVAVVVGLAGVHATGWAWLDPVLALAVALNIARIGWNLLRRSFDGLMDRSLDDDEVASVRGAIEGLLEPGETYHALRTRRAGSLRMVDYHLLVPGHTAVRQAHDREMQIGHAIQAALTDASTEESLGHSVEVTAHIEPVEEPAAWNDARVL
jgi:cation diffusion facilitator family transporter